MSDEVLPRWENLAKRYNLAGQPEWRKLLTHFKLSEGFALVVLLVVDADGAAWCRHELENHLSLQGKKLIAIDLATPEALRQLPAHFLDTILSPNDACLWLAAVEPDYSQGYAEWRGAWRHTLALLNAHRNPIREKFHLTLVFAGAPWLQEVMREIAPDLWSVRTFVAHIQPLPLSATEPMTAQATTLPPAITEESGGGDPVFALHAADKLRGAPGKELALAGLLHRAGEGFVNLQDWPSAEKAFSEALELKKRHDAPPSSLLDTLIAFGGQQVANGRIPEATRLFEDALEIGRRTGNRLVETAMLGNLGSIYLDLGDTQKAIDLANEHLRLAREIASRKYEADALGILGNAFLNLGEAPKAIDFFGQELSISREIDNRIGEGIALGNLGRAYAFLGDFQKSINFSKHALKIAREIGNTRFEGIITGNLGIAYRGLGEIRQAIACYEEALKLARRLGNKKLENSILGNLGNAYRALGNLPKAMEFYELSLSYARESGYRFGESGNLANLGIAHLELNDPPRGLEFLDQALVIARELGDRRLEANTLWNSALAWERLNDRTQAIQLAEAALEIFQAIEDPNAAKIIDQLAKWRRQA